MPYIEVKTNVELKDAIKETLSKELGKEIQLLGKSEDWLMLNFIDRQDMYFKGSSAPCIIAEVKVYGSISSSQIDNFTPTLTKTISKLTGVSEERIYINYFSTEKWGYSGFNF